MYAIVEDSGSQIKLAPGAILDIDVRGESAEGETITFDRVLAIKDQGDGPATLGTPYVDGASVTAEVVGEVKGDKIDVIKFKRRKNYHRKTGHRQQLLRIRVGEISAAAKPKKKKAATKKTPAKSASAED
ncbi:MAG: 50S ribosomal protein L21 [Phycisphaerales bacterium]|nr:50S ribosomal protein L21 [Phycisphaerales bacterium]